MVPTSRQTMLFSATMPGPIVALARTFLNQPVQIRAEHAAENTSTDHIDQFAYRAHSMDKVELLARILQARNRGLTLIFVRTKRSAAKITDDLIERGFAVGAVHGDLGQGAREQALRAFRSGKVDVLVATDVAARGLDVDGITHVINYQAPEDEMTYVHRIGRTARAGASGTAITFVDWDDVPRWKLICDKLTLPFHEPVETYSTSPHLYIELDIPQGITGTLPRGDRTRAGLDAETLEDLGGREPSRKAAPKAAGREGQRPATRAPRAASTPRDRTRTRSGQPVDGTAASSDSADAPAGSSSAPRRRRRRGGGRGTGSGGGSGDTAASSA
jgi:superfamily II DNA/RNA helicase